MYAVSKLAIANLLISIEVKLPTKCSLVTAHGAAKLATIGSDDVLAPGRHQAITLANACMTT